MIFKTKDYPVVFLSYDEENRHENFNRLIEVCPTAIHLNGVKGIVHAHKKIVEIVKNISTHVIIVSADNFVNENLLTQEINFSDNIDLDNSVISFSGKNYVNGNIYKNGGVRVWPVKLLETLVDLESVNHLQLNRWLSDVHVEYSPNQAWRSGFREGIKLCTKNGKLVNHISDINWRNYERLWRWTHIGSDVENGVWAILGARQAAYIALTKQSYNINDVQDFDYMNNLFEEQYKLYKNTIVDECNRLGDAIKIFTGDTRITRIYEPVASKEYKDSTISSRCSPETFIKYKYPGDYDIVFMSNGEPNADRNFELLKQRHPKAKRINGYENIRQAYIDAAKITNTDYFWVVDADMILVDDFYFEYHVPFYDEPKVRIWRSQDNNKKIYEYGGVKLLPRFYTIHMQTNKPTLTEGISNLYESVIKISNFVKFNTEKFSIWGNEL